MNSAQKVVYWQAHRGGGIHDAPDNTMAASRYAWNLGGIPEFDIRTTKDGVIVCLHDETLSRTSTANQAIRDVPIRQLTFDDVRYWDVGVKFDAKFEGEKVPSLEEVFIEMEGKPQRKAYLDLKDVDLNQLAILIDKYKVNKQIIFTHNVQNNCISMKGIAAGVTTMLWIGGSPDQIKEKFSKAVGSSFVGLDQVQLHLNSTESVNQWPYQLDKEYLQYALTETKRYGIDLEVFPFAFDSNSIHELLNIGIRWFATDAPRKFIDAVQLWQEKR